MADRRISTGIEGLDEITHGGIPEHQSCLLLGSAGTGKTLSSLQWLIDGESKDECSLFIAFSESYEKVQRNVRSFGWDLDRLEFVDLNPVKEEEQSTEEYSVFPPSEVERDRLWQRIYEVIEEVNPDRVAIDSLTQLRYLSTDDYQFRKQILRLVTFLHEKECTSLLIFEPAELEDEASVALAVDGIIWLHMEVSPHRLTGIRSLEVQKLRGTDFMSGYHSMRITDDGIKVFPHRVEKPVGTKPGKEVLSSGIDNLDALIGGGLESGTTTILSGPCGAGKTTLGMQFATVAAQGKQRAIIYTFEESTNSIITRSEGLGLPVGSLIEKGLLRIERVNPMELYPDEFLGMVRAAVEEEGYRMVMIDSLHGYKMAMGEFGSLDNNIHNLVTYLNQQEVTTILTNELEHITGDLTATEIGITHMVDTLVLLRYAEYQGRIIKVVTCLKKRYSPLDSVLRELRITSEKGIHIGRELKELRGILMGAPSKPQE